MKNKKTAQPEQQAPAKVIYVGPSIIGVATRNTVYDGIPNTLQTAIETAPFLAGLCIPLETLPEAMAQIRAKSGAFYTLYNKALQYGVESKGEN